MAKEHSQFWATFFNKEQALLDYVNTSCELLDVVTGCEPEYKKFSEFKGVTVTKAPMYIRCVVGLPDGGSDFELLYSEMVESLMKAREADNQTSKRLLNRFPVRYDNVSSITTRTNRAIKSFALKPDTEVILNKIMAYDTEGVDIVMEGFNKDVKALIEHDYKTASIKEYTTSTHYGSTPTIALVIDSNELFEKFNTDHIQARVETGKQYRATLRRADETRGKQVNYGFIVLDNKSKPGIFQASPQQPRANRLENTAKEVKLPISTETSFYIKDQ
tara:strand:+ start:16832 stop:17656 length:825 start_codon:yes stop_codon:yes gene_type:complete